MGKLRILIADTDAAFIAAAQRSIHKNVGMKVIGSAPDGVSALQQIETEKPNVLLTDLQLPCMDGLDLLRRASQLNPPPVSIACTRFYSDMLVDAARECGASYVLYKPIQYETLPRCIADCWRNHNRRIASLLACDTEKAQQVLLRLRVMLDELGIPMRMLGRLYITEAMLRILDDERLLRNLSKGLYAELAAQLHTLPDCVERALRTAITYAYNHGGLRRYFSVRPSNRFFLESLLRHLRMDDVLFRNEEF